jgi:aldose 1-epimerase
MLPWTNRLDGGRFPSNGTVHHLPINRPDEGNALHGLGRDAPWAVEVAGPDHAVLTQRLRAGPFDYAAQLEVRLGGAALSLRLRLQNTGTEACPMGIGWHPWFARPPGCSLRFHATDRMVKDDRNLPVAAEPSDGLDSTVGEILGLDGHFAGWDGTVAMHRPDLVLTLQASGAWARNLHVFAPSDHRQVLCLEPVSHVPNVVNTPSLERYGAMRVLAPGEAMEGGVELAVL